MGTTATTAFWMVDRCSPIMLTWLFPKLMGVIKPYKTQDWIYILMNKIVPTNYLGILMNKIVPTQLFGYIDE
jgi:hypothetical protein